ncbi:MAG: YitT family protein [Bacteroidales bacterium]|nr:YitT family protein [Bacteroidales bacterium]
MNKASARKAINEYLTIVVGCLIVSVGFVFFINPYKFVPGGVFGTSIVLHNLMPQLQVGTFSYMISIPLLLLSYFLLGRGLGAKTLFATLVTPFFMNLISKVVYPSEEALQRLSPSEICGGMLDLSANLMLAAVVGSVLIGIGSGLIMRSHATTGGTDIVAMLIHKYLRVRFSNALLSVDGTIVSFGLIVIGFGVGADAPAENTWLPSGYSLVCIFIMSRTLAYIASGSKNNKLMIIITPRDGNTLRDFIIGKLDRTATVLDSTGLYSQQAQTTLMMMVRMREVEAVTTAVKTIAPEAFVIVTDAYDAYGKRWKPFPDKHSIEIR